MLAAKSTKLSRVAQLSSVDALATIADDLDTARIIAEAFANVLDESINKYEELERNVADAMGQVESSLRVIEDAKEIMNEFSSKIEILGINPNDVNEYREAMQELIKTEASIDAIKSTFGLARQYFDI